MTAFTRVGPGTPEASAPTHSARWINTVTDSALYYQEQVRNGFDKGKRPKRQRKLDSVDLQNLTGGDLVRGNVLQIGDSILSDVDVTHPWFAGNLPSTTEIRKLAILARAAPDTHIQEAFTGGVCIGLVDVLDTNHTHAKFVVGSVTLESAYDGPLSILSPKTARGIQELWVRWIPEGGTSNQQEFDIIFKKGIVKSGEAAYYDAELQKLQPGHIKLWRMVSPRWQSGKTYPTSSIVTHFRNEFSSALTQWEALVQTSQEPGPRSTQWKESPGAAELLAGGDGKAIVETYPYTIPDTKQPKAGEWVEITTYKRNAEFYEGYLEVRNNDRRGSLGLRVNHGLQTGDKVDLVWGGGKRTDVILGTVRSASRRQAVPFLDSGEGDPLPAVNTELIIFVTAEENHIRIHTCGESAGWNPSEFPIEDNEPEESQ